ncbi:cysteine synthase family protein [Schinkia azotoformans]|uniref:O-acetylserine lyase n=1 Tax=Schinkia azotoformans LMG 9581 TaxID=1131731 RepID=K6BVX6_SCHAZ|nr:cysteine synthase family protein [Schinkia azotoformans]EKN63065.1 O-acetylserine lyase [Schinkia azotoformans LMG 9581]MEC1639126.1 cysteine synthase family protein [Schinkia azotoformans]MEC1722303.1 cysteine synthase family protein [Schinkia azotoformans]MEC1945155.1 cysteine synthase family protein [Schinkia azotoformans]MED4354662.1 cysteine synthase family protein [Schinkia azotoformans]
MKYYKHVHELIGNTPLVEITQFELPEGVRLFAKLEYLNPGGSVKDRLGKKLLQTALEKGYIAAGGTIIEPTAGNTGIGLALAAVGTGINVMFVVPEKFSVEKQELMRALGATVVNTPTKDGMTGAIAKTKELLNEIPNSYCPQQFENPANPETYFETLGPEIWNALEGQVNVFVAGAGSGGTFTGTAQYLKEQNPAIKTVIVEPEGSILNGGESGPHRTEGIGMEFIPLFVNTNLFDAIHTISDDAAFNRVSELSQKCGLLVGSSSGAAFEASLREAQAAKPGTNIVTIFPDSSERYLSSGIYKKQEFWSEKYA